MDKDLYIAEKPSVAREFAKALKLNMKSKDGYMESEEAIVTWCVGHLVTMSYPEAYDAKYKRWSLQTLPFIPSVYKYEVIENVKKQFSIVSELLNRPDVKTIYVCTDSGREGEYIYRLVEAQAHVQGKKRRRVWIDSQTEEEILRGIREAKDLSAYDALGDAAFLRAKEDYLMGINFSRLLTLKYGPQVKGYLKRDRAVISVGRVMTCVLGMVVDREREIRNFVKTPFYRVVGSFNIWTSQGGRCFEGEWRAVEGSRYFGSPLLYKENGFREEKDARALIAYLTGRPVPANPAIGGDASQIAERKEGGPAAEAALAGEKTEALLEKIEKKKETKNPPLLYNLAELQNDCSKYFKISPDETLRIVQELYEKKMTTYPRTDARVLSTAVAKEIYKNISGLRQYGQVAPFAARILEEGSYKGIARTRYVNDKQITDHYAIIPTGQGLNNLNGLAPTAAKVYEIVCRRFLAIFYPPAVYQKVSLTTLIQTERFFSSFKVLAEEGYLRLMQFSFGRKAREDSDGTGTGSNSLAESTQAKREESPGDEEKCDADFLTMLQGLKKGTVLPVKGFAIKEGETSPPKRYNSGTMILTMENAGQFIEEEELRAQIKGSGIGTSATRAEILKKLVSIQYLSLNKKTQIITPTLMGEMIYDVVGSSIRQLLNPALTASWEKGLTLVAEGKITSEEYMEKLSGFITRRTDAVKQLENQTALYRLFDSAAQYYKK